MSSAWLNPAGGVRYHLRALRYSSTLWFQFRFALAEWLYGWRPPERRLVLVGPSAGYCFQPFFFERFEEVLCLEPDPLARRLFSWRLARAPLEQRPRLRFETRDCLLGGPDRLRERLVAEPDAAVLFANVVGQLRVLLGAASLDDIRFAALRRGLLGAVGDRSWASFHDRVSGPLEPLLDSGYLCERRLTNAEIVALFYPGHELPEELIRVDDGGELLDHGTEGFFPDAAPHAYFTWQLMPGAYHLIEATARVTNG